MTSDDGPAMRSRVTAESLLARSIEGDRRLFARDVRHMLNAAESIANGMPSPSRSVSGDLIRLSQEVALLIRLATRIEASSEVLSVMTEDPEGRDVRE